MGRECEICGKGTTVGNRITRRGMAKNKGGVGRKTTGIARRTFKPNLQVVKTNLGGTVQRIRVCAKCIRAGKAPKVA